MAEEPPQERQAPAGKFCAMSMIDRVARAIHAALPRTAISGAMIAWDDMSDEGRDEYVIAAHRAISAMRVPSETMLREGDRRDLSHDAANIWERMVLPRFRSHIDARRPPAITRRRPDRPGE
jgi:hypothetical protein